jgi:hypothetical protein
LRMMVPGMAQMTSRFLAPLGMTNKEGVEGEGSQNRDMGHIHPTLTS